MQEFETKARKLQADMNAKGFEMTIEEARAAIRLALAALGEMVKPGIGQDYLERIASSK